MAAERRRETLIALRARRTAHRVATDVYLFQHSKPLTIECVQCHRPFCPLNAETICPGCVEIHADRSPPSLPGGKVINVPCAADTWRWVLAETTWTEWAMLAVFLCCLAIAIWALFAAQTR